MAISLPEQFREWKIQKKIGEGTSGTVYRAVNEQTGEVCAIKVVALSASELEKARLVQDLKGSENVQLYMQQLTRHSEEEFRVMEELKDEKNIVRIFDHCVVMDEKVPEWKLYLRIELLESLEDLRIHRELSEKDIISMMIDLCGALDACEKRGILHLDVKTGNIFVDGEGNFKLGDFGSACRISARENEPGIQGTCAYMSPEIYAGKAGDHRSDIYSLGMVAYRLLNRGREPFVDQGRQIVSFQDRAKALDRRMQGEALPPPSEAAEELSKIILRACASDPEKRYSCAGELRKDLEDCLAYDRGGVSGNAAHKRRRRIRAYAIAAGVIGLMAAGIGVYRSYSVKPQGSALQQVQAENTADGAVEAAEQLALTLSELAGKKDYKAFASYYVNTDEESIRKQFAEMAVLADYPDKNIFVLENYEGIYLVNVVAYRTGSDKQNASGDLDESAWLFCLSKEADGWKINYDSDISARIQGMLHADYYPDGYRSAIQEERPNRVICDPLNFMYADQEQTYQDLVTYQVKYFWQDRDDNVLLCLYLTNGTAHQVHFSQAEVDLEDPALGRILHAQMDLDTSVEAGRSKTVFAQVAAKDVLTGSQAWSSEGVTPHMTCTIN